MEMSLEDGDSKDPKNYAMKYNDIELFRRLDKNDEMSWLNRIVRGIMQLLKVKDSFCSKYCFCTTLCQSFLFRAGI